MAACDNDSLFRSKRGVNRLDEIFAKRKILVKHFLAIANVDAAALPDGLGEKVAIGAGLLKRAAEVEPTPGRFGVGHDAGVLTQQQWSEVNRRESADDDPWPVAINLPAAARRR